MSLIKKKFEVTCNLLKEVYHHYSLTLIKIKYVKIE